MNKKTKFDNWSPRTDLALEISNTLRANKEEDYVIPGVDVQTEQDEEHRLTVTKVIIKDKTGEEQMGKPQGHYITVESPTIKENDPEAHHFVIQAVAEALQSVLPKKKNKYLEVLVIGLGNRFATPDTLGPKVANKVLVTRHLSIKVPNAIDESVCKLSSLAPGVMGLTGIETAEIISGVAEHVKPDCIIAIDALAARSASRINSTIQIADTGISPGAGVGNCRKQLNKESMGCPVIGIGVPTVVDTTTLVADTFDTLLQSMLKEAEHSPFYDMLKELTEQEKYQLIRENIFPEIADLFVTPKDIDEVMEYLTSIIANAINIAVHPGITLEDINKYTY
ncbi:GPR endopeptidase [Sporanaerobium hydrogeniformans]|uniref:GPR endopeptidase n=1 Tax=Sporanaerobium hydrogeniformans TaxID=3072179 RepID=A0AC61DGJ5_9FIRM|nr:GPR endopeptidase [Sporanaerobium hydrogeniformans]PHV71507.1 GPR endopeptidase [Sporanaerobium hydrogeniformans]